MDISTSHPGGINCHNSQQ